MTDILLGILHILSVGVPLSWLKPRRSLNGNNSQCILNLQRTATELFRDAGASLFPNALLKGKFLVSLRGYGME